MYPKDIFVNFVHIPKCAGSTFRSSFIDPYIPKEMVGDSIFGLRELRRFENDLQFVRGHYAYGYDKYLPSNSPVHSRRFLNLVALREPVDQMISYYYYKIQVNQVDQYGKPPSPNSRYPVAEFYRERPLICNMQTRMLAGIHWANHKSPIAQLGSFMPALMFRFAWQNLTNRFHWVFFQDNADADFAEFASFYDIEYKPSRYEKTVTKARPAKEEITEEERRELLKINAVDQKLYERAKSWRGGKAFVREVGDD